MDQSVPSGATVTAPPLAVTETTLTRTTLTETMVSAEITGTDDATVSATVEPSSGRDMTESAALAYAMSRVRWYNRHRKLARGGAVAHDLLLLLTGAATTLTAALNADAWITSVLAAT